MVGADMILVRFTQSYRAGVGPHYTVGEQAGFDDETAADLIARGWAVQVQTAAPPSPPPPPPAPTKEIERPGRDKMIARPTKSK